MIFGVNCAQVVAMSVYCRVQNDELIMRYGAIRSLLIFYRSFDKYICKEGSLKRGGIKAKTMGLIAHDRMKDRRPVADW